MEKIKGFAHGMIIAGCIAQAAFIGNAFGESAWAALSAVVLLAVITHAIIDMVGWE